MLSVHIAKVKIDTETQDQTIAELGLLMNQVGKLFAMFAEDEDEWGWGLDKAREMAEVYNLVDKGMSIKEALEVKGMDASGIISVQGDFSDEMVEGIPKEMLNNGEYTETKTM